MLVSKTAAARTSARFREPKSRKRSDCGGTPDCRGSVEPAHIRAIFEDDARAEKSDARDDIRGDSTSRRGIIVEQQSAHDKGRRSRSYEGIGSSSGHALSPLPFQPNRCAHSNGEQQTNGKLKRTDSYHVFLRSGGAEE
jgi:hypothetical protein